MGKCNTCIISALPFATPEATVPIPASETSFTDTLALGFTYSLSKYWCFLAKKLEKYLTMK